MAEVDSELINVGEVSNDGNNNDNDGNNNNNGNNHDDIDLSNGEEEEEEKEEDDDDFIEVVRDVRAHDRIPRPDEIYTLSGDESGDDDHDMAPTVITPMRRSESEVLECPICLENLDSEGNHRYS